MTEMGVKWLQHQETARNNRAVLEETNRANLAKEGIQRDTLVETNRSNLAKEAEMFRSNSAREGIMRDEVAEKVRSNQARETQARKDSAMRYGGGYGRALANQEASVFTSPGMYGVGALYETGRMLFGDNGILGGVKNWMK